ncbi:VOC family protein [Chitinophaga niabensis]|uniref:VOC family protein n=1 Tax=Chitinophaga niabensis TaxID=536979 RepID=UPI0031BB2042
MKTKMVWANLPVKDIERTNEFFLALGFTPNGDRTAEIVSFIIAENKFIINFFQEEQFKTATESAIPDTKKSAEIIFSLSAESREEVNEWAQKVKKAGGTVFSEAQEIQGNMYNMAFADPDGHRWNVLYC